MNISYPVAPFESNSLQSSSLRRFYHYGLRIQRLHHLPKIPNEITSHRVGALSSTHRKGVAEHPHEKDLNRCFKPSPLVDNFPFNQLHCLDETKGCKGM